MYNSQITVRINKDDKDNFKDMVKQSNSTMSDVIRKAIENYLFKQYVLKLFGL